jgi:hypothetical protein
MTVIKKLSELGGLEVYVVNPGEHSTMANIIGNTNAGLVLVNENSMINTRRIDNCYDGKVESESVDLRAMTGNPLVLNLIEQMRKQRKTAFFPGTVMQNFGGYCLPTMPVVIDGELDLRVKVTANECVDSYAELARKLFDEEYAESIRKFSGFFCDEPMKRLVTKLKQESARVKLIKSYKVGDLVVLPLICNELSRASESYTGAPVDIILHSADGLYDSMDKRNQAYERFFYDMRKINKLNQSALLAFAEAGRINSSGILASVGRSIISIEP